MASQNATGASDTKFHQTITTWDGFRQNWSGLHNFMMGGDLTREFHYEMPPIERVIDEVRKAPRSIVRSGVKAAEFDLTDIKSKFVGLPLAEAMRSRFILAHFRLHPDLTGKGQVFEGLEEQWVEPWRRKLKEEGFEFDNVFVILFASGPNSASNYHMDYTHQLAWQRQGTKHFIGLKDPDRWTTAEQRGRCELQGMVRPAAIQPPDTYTVVQPPGSVLWNAHTTPHWVETHDGCAATLTLVHDKLRLHGKLCPHAEAAGRWREENGMNKQKPQEAVKAAGGNY